ncbi:SDR family oxidoreductase [Arthrobacter sp. CDRTa11]|uniref:SDR family oxidoreductase n=1 Tax=Arthrobacter sp. CDRTa11 TaxID=2651199 RepID=UPI002265D7F6|nr:SDR family oxidoreductase [Arthrobacter sp. CDRTa11]UZX02951.1 SDR family oxidoreductase [Arthrobacter sp. CDRTa11]
MESSPFDLTGSTALVTGSSRGIGNALAAGLAAAGAAVVLHGLDPERLAQARKSFIARFGSKKIGAVAFDITDESSVARGIAEIEENFGDVDILVNNAGIQHRVPLLELAVEDWNRVISTDLTSAFLVGREVARRMVPRGRGKIINIGSVQSDLARPTIGAYTAAKGGIRNLTRAMAAEWAASGLQINAVAPGYIHTEMTQPLVDDVEFNSWICKRTPAGRWGTVGDLTGPVQWLASRGSDYVNGQTIFIDGGMTAVV